MNLPENYESFPVDLKALWQFKRHLHNITRARGYSRDVMSVYIDRRDFENCEDALSCNLIWGPEEVLNASDIDRSLGIVNIKATVLLDWIIEAESQTEARSFLKADVMTYLLKDFNFTLPELDNGESPTVFNLMPANITPYGDNQTGRRCKLEMEVYVWYKTQLGNHYARA